MLACISVDNPGGVRVIEKTDPTGAHVGLRTQELHDVHGVHSLGVNVRSRTLRHGLHGRASCTCVRHFRLGVLNSLREERLNPPRQ